LRHHTWCGPYRFKINCGGLVVDNVQFLMDRLDAAVDRAGRAEREAADWKLGFSSGMSRLNLICRYLASGEYDRAVNLFGNFPEDEAYQREAAVRLAKSCGLEVS